MQLKHRMKRLESAFGMFSPCRKCGGHGRVVLQADAPRPSEPLPAGCATCGQLQLILDGTPNLKRMVLDAGALVSG